MNNLKEILGSLLILTSIFDAIKYYWAAKKVIEVGTAKGHSRKFLNASISNDFVKLGYGIAIKDIFIIVASILALFTMCYNYYIIYLFYPYKKRGLLNFKRPNIFLYFINSIISNRLRKRL